MMQAILTRLKNNDQAALKELFDHYYTPLTRFALRLTADPMTAEEIAQDAFIYLWEKRSALHIKVSIEAYLYKSVKNKCINHLKSKTARFAKAVDGEEAFMTLQGPEPDVVSGELRILIEEGLSKLPSQTAGIFSFSRHAGLSYTEIAKKLDISPKTVEYHVSSALRFLKHFLSRYGYLIILVHYFS